MEASRGTAASRCQPESPLPSTQKLLIKSPICSQLLYSKLERIPQFTWFDVRVFYLSVCSSWLTEPPDALTMNCFPEGIASAIELNSARIACFETLVLKRDKWDKHLAEVTYVTTDNLRTTGALCLEIFDKEEILLRCKLKNPQSLTNARTIDARNQNHIEKGQGQGIQPGWKLECTCVMGSSGSSFTRSRSSFAAFSQPPPTVEVCLAGRVCGVPFILTNDVKLVARPKYWRHNTLDVIKEQDEVDDAGKDENSEDCELEGRTTEGCDRFCASYSSGYLDGEDGQLSWFNAGVRVGLSISLGMCVGLGLGVGILSRAYLSATRKLHRKTFRRKLL